MRLWRQTEHNPKGHAYVCTPMSMSSCRVYCCATQGGLAPLGLMTSDETLAELGFLGQRMTYVCQTAHRTKTKVVNPKYCPQMSPFYCSPDAFDCKDFLSLVVCGCMYAFMWLALDQTDSEECSLDQAKKIVEYEKGSPGEAVTAGYRDLELFCIFAWHIPLLLSLSASSIEIASEGCCTNFAGFFLSIID